MNKYKVIYYLSIVVFIVNLMAMIGSLIGWFTIVEMRDSKIIDFFKKIKRIAHPY